jgi:hypothetical protein
MKPTDTTLEALWKNVLDRWENDAAHHAFLDHCQASGALDEAAVRYRGMKGDRERGPIAEKRLTAVLMLAMSKLEVTRSRPETSSSALGKWLLISFFVAGSLLVLWYLSRT